MKKLVIFGTSAFAKVAHYYFLHDSDYTVVAFTVDAPYLQATTFQGLPVVAFEEIVDKFPPSECDMVVAIGIQKANQQRATKVAEAEAKGYKLASFLSSKARVPNDLVVRPNTFVMEDAFVQPFVEIGQDTIIWPRCIIGFDTRIGDHCWLVASILGESVVVGDHTFIGINATISSSCSVGKSNVIGAGALILRDTRDFEVYKGSPSTPSRVPSFRLRHI